MTNNKLKILGDLETEIMEVVWNNKAISVRQVLLALQKKRQLAYTTVMTVMSRLHSKGILKRKLDQTGAFIYLPAKDKQSFMAKASEKLIKGFLKEYGDVAVAQFVDVIETMDTKQSKAWKDKLKKILYER